MTWFKVDDTLAFHEKAVAAGNAAMGLWVRAGSWCSAQLNNGFVPDHMIGSLGTKGQASRLVEVKLWQREQKGYRFHQWNEDGRQPTREEVENKRQEWRDKKRRQRRNDAGQFDSSPAVSLRDTPGDSRESPAVPSRPVPSRPVENSFEGGSHVSSARAEQPPLIPRRCPNHQYEVIAPKCGACADARIYAEAQEARPRLSLVAQTPAKVPHCGTCDEYRMRETPFGQIRCPECHPLAREESA